MKTFPIEPNRRAIRGIICAQAYSFYPEMVVLSTELLIFVRVSCFLYEMMQIGTGRSDDFLKGCDFMNCLDR